MARLVSNTMTSKHTIRLLQIHATDCCNFSCEGCSHAAPAASKRFYSFDEYRPHLEKLSEYASFDHITITGGEAFLHKNLIEFVRGVRAVMGGEQFVQIDTNGFWLKDWQSYEEVLKELSFLRVTYHPQQRIPAKEMEEITETLELKFGYGMPLHFPSHFCEPIFYDTPVTRHYCKFCLQLMTDGRVCKCNIIAYSKFHGFQTTEPFERLKHEGFYDIHSGDAASFARWCDCLHSCCDYCGFTDTPSEKDAIIPHNASTT